MKYQLGQEVYYICESNVCSALIQSRCHVENLHENWNEHWCPWGGSGIFYKTCHGIFNEAKIFASKKELADAICS